MAVLAHKALNGLSPQYLADNCQLITTTGRRRLRSSNVATCDVPRTRIILGDRSFTDAGPCLSNNLPLHLRDSELPLLEFRQLLKMHLSGWWSKCIVTYFIYSAFYKCTYLLTYLRVWFCYASRSDCFDEGNTFSGCPSVYLFIRPSRKILLSRYLMNGLGNLDETYSKYSLSRYWWPG